MGVFDIKNVAVKETCGMYEIIADNGYYIHLPEHEEHSYTSIVILQPSYDFSLVEVVVAADLPENAEIF